MATPAGCRGENNIFGVKILGGETFLEVPVRNFKQQISWTYWIRHVSAAISFCRRAALRSFGESNIFLAAIDNLKRDDGTLLEHVGATLQPRNMGRNLNEEKYHLPDPPFLAFWGFPCFFPFVISLLLGV